MFQARTHVYINKRNWKGDLINEYRDTFFNSNFDNKLIEDTC